MTADQLIALNGLLARESAARADAGDAREKALIVDDILAEIGAPLIGIPLAKLEQMVSRGTIGIPRVGASE